MIYLRCGARSGFEFPERITAPTDVVVAGVAL